MDSEVSFPMKPAASAQKRGDARHIAWTMLMPRDNRLLTHAVSKGRKARQPVSSSPLGLEDPLRQRDSNST
eukprot:3096137-Amphidinium_carterae.1